MLHGEGSPPGGINKFTHTHGEKKLGTVFVYLNDRKVVTSHGGTRYTLIVRDHFSRYTWVYFMCHKSDAAETFKQFLSETRADGFPSQMVTVRSNGVGDVCRGKFRDLYRSRCIKQKFTTDDSSQFNGVAERELDLIETAVMARRIQTHEL